MSDYERIRADLRAFVDEREWDAFHNPKDLALSLSVEAGELLELFQWRDPKPQEMTAEERERVAEELADVVMYAILLADKTGTPLLDAVARKLDLNRARYPVHKARGRAEKHDRL